ncbi:MAG: histidine kinase [Lachnospiraceae bacterium]|nr:histidine kinase [Lachnospiraceae bacterium]
MKRRNIQTILSTYLLILAAAILTVVSVFFTVLQYRTLRTQEIGNLRENCLNAARSLRQDIKEMDTILLYSIASSDLKETFYAYQTEENAFLRNQLQRRLASELIWLKGFNFDVRQLNLYGMEKDGYGVGSYNGDLTVAVSDFAWYEEAKERAGKSCIVAPAADVIVSDAAGLPADTQYLSLYRMFYNDLHVPMGFIGVKEQYDAFFANVATAGKPYQTTVAVYDADGRRLYPAEEIYAYDEKRSSGDGEIRNPLTGKKQYLCFSEVPEYGLTVVMAADSADFMAPVYRSVALSLLATIITFAACLVVITILSRKLSDPLRKMYDFLSDSHKAQYEKLTLSDTGVREIDKLRDSLNESISYQENTTQAMLTLKEQEVQAEMLALQAQMNPHFLYNSLSTIAEMAEEGQIKQVAAMCEDITAILRYISSNREQRIRVEEELEQVDIYLHCMKRRFGEELQYHFDIEDEILDCMVPKLCVQLLVENAIRSVQKNLPPWEITVSGGRDGEDWHITVSDNGDGFDPAVDKSLRASMDEILATGTLPSLKIKGMGILNIFIRLYLLDGIPFVFDFGNRKEGGAFVTVGGHIGKSEKTGALSGTTGG